MSTPKLINQIRDVIWVRYYSTSTEQSYIQWIKRNIYFHHKTRPREMGVTQISAYLTHQAVNKNVSAGT